MATKAKTRKTGTGREAAPPDSTHVPLARSLGYHVRELSESFMMAVHQGASAIGVTLSQWRYLRELVEEDGLTHGELTRRVGRQGPTTVAAVRAMARQSLVELRDSPVDRRRTHIFVTQRGRDVVERMGVVISKVELLSLAGLTPEEVDTFKRLLVRVQRNLDAHAMSRNAWTMARTQELAKGVGL